MTRIATTVVLFLILSACASVPANVQNTPTMPDYSGWVTQVGETLNVVLQGQDETLNVNEYGREVTDPESGKYVLVEYLMVVNDKEDKPWLGFYVQMSYTQSGTGSAKYYIFQHSTDNGWVFVRDFSMETNADDTTYDFLKNYYNLVIR